MVTAVSRQPILPIFKVQAVQEEFLDCLWTAWPLKMGRRLSRSATNIPRVTTQKRDGMNCTAAEAWNLVQQIWWLRMLYGSELVSYLIGVNSTWTESSEANFITDYQHLLHPVAQTPGIFPFPPPLFSWFGVVTGINDTAPLCRVATLPYYKATHVHIFSYMCNFFITLFEIHVLLYTVYA